MPPRLRRRPRVALIVETSMVAGRGMLRGIAQYVRERGPWSIVCEPRGLEQSPPVWLKRWRGDGIIARLATRRLTHAVLKTGVPAVDLLGMAPHPCIPLVHPDDAEIGRLAARHLLERGFRAFAYCGVRATWARQPCAGFEEVLAAAGRTCHRYLLPLSNRTRESVEADQRRLTHWIARLPKPVGIMACSDTRAQRVLDACHRAGAIVPDEVALIGVGNDDTICEFCDPPLSSVIAAYRQAGYEAARLLARMMRGGTVGVAPLSVKPLGVITRQSTDVIAVDDPDTMAAVRFIRAHACDGIQVGDVAEHCLLSRTELKRRFRRLLGRTVHDQILEERLKRAEQLLADTELPIAHIAKLAGFHRQEYLGVVFKARRGKTPGQYRRQL